MYFIENIFFFFISLNLILLSIFKNPILSILSFITIVISFSLLLIYTLNNDLLALVLILLYVGAIAIVFLFVVMMLNIKIIETKITKWGYLVCSLFYLVVILLEYNQFINKVIFFFYKILYYDLYYRTLNFLELINIIIYNYQIIWLILITLILLVSMIGSIILTYKAVIRTKRQSINYQVNLKGWQVLDLKKLCIF